MRTAMLVALFAIGMASANATGFDLRYTVRAGDLNADGRQDLYLRYAPSFVMIPLDDILIPVPTSRRGVGEFVLINTSGGGFQVQGNLTSTDRAAVGAWLPAAVQAMAGDFNADAYTDILLKNVAQAVPGAYDQIVFASAQQGSAPSSVRAIDPELRHFLFDLAEWFNNKDRNHFASGFRYVDVEQPYPVQLQTWLCDGTHYNELQYSAEELSWCTYLGYRTWNHTVRTYYFNTESFSQLAINLLVKLLPHFDRLAPLSADASSIEGYMETALGADFMRNLLSQGGSDDFLVDVFGEYVNGIPGFPGPRIPGTVPDAGDQIRTAWDLLDDIASRSIPHIIAGILKDVIFASDLCDHGVRHDYYVRGTATTYANNTAGTPMCANGSSARCNLDYVFGREQLMHPAPGFFTNNVPIVNGQTGIAQFGIPGPLDDGGPVVFEVVPSQRLHRNRTLPTHIWHDGAVERQTYLRSGSNQIFIKTHGWGTGACSGFNENAGIFVFTVLDDFIKLHVTGAIPRLHE